jgi:PAS domain S-box-containing protein
MQGEKIEILVIEDDRAQVALITETLASEQRQQYAVHHVNYLSEGLEALERGNFDCVLADLGLPDSQGLETALSIRRFAKQVPIVVLTVLDDEEAALKALDMNIQDYLIKGEINSAVLTRSIRYAIQRHAVATKLAESEERLRLASQAADIGMWHWDLVKGEMTFDAKSRELFGFPPDSRPTHQEAKGRVHPDDRERVDSAVRRAWSENEEYSEEMRILLPDGGMRWIVSKGRAHYDEHGKPLRADGINMDITKRKQGEEALRASELKFSRIFRGVPALIIVSTVKEGIIKDVNQSALQTLGYKREELVGQNLFDLNLWQHPPNRQQLIEELVNRRPVVDIEVGYVCKEGRRITGLLSAELIEVEGEQCALMLIRDITSRKAAEEALLLAKEEWERTFNTVPDLIAILDTNNRIVRINAAMAGRIGKSPEDCFGLPCYKVFHRTDMPPESCPHVKAVSESRQQITEVQQAGTDTWFLVSYTPLADAEGKPAGVVHVARDITERKLAEKRIEQLNAELAVRADDLEAANKELEAFNYTAAHDLRQPLNVIYGNCQAVEMLCGKQIGEDCRGYLHEIRQGIKRMTQLLDALLDFSRMSRIEPQRAAVDLSSIARAVAKELKDTDTARKASFVIADAVTVNGDPALLEIVLRNLLGNAWKYTGSQEEAIIEFGGAEIDGKSTYFVRDNGPGFEMADADKLFAPFQRLPGTQSVRGFGIGLATVQRIISRHGGRIWAEGTPGKGATFYFTLD